MRRVHQAGAPDRADAVFVNISFVGSNALAKELGKEGEGVVISQVVPFPEDASIPLVDRYQKALKAADPEGEFGFVSLEGYMVGRLVVEALGRLGRSVTRAGLLTAIKEGGAFDLGGITLSYGPDNNRAWTGFSSPSSRRTAASSRSSGSETDATRGAAVSGTQIGWSHVPGQHEQHRDAGSEDARCRTHPGAA